MRLSVSNILMLFAIMLILFQPVRANAYNFTVDDTFACLNATQQIEKELQIKDHLLTTISSVESGRWHEESQQTIAWPWTINAEGKGMFFKTKDEAVKKVKELQQAGVKSIDVGCMQINLFYHKEAFKNIEEALDPKTNVAYGAEFLKKLHSQKGDWLKAVMAYHSSLPVKANRYKNKIVLAYAKVKNAQAKLEEAFMSQKKIGDRLKQARIARMSEEISKQMEMAKAQKFAEL